MLRSLLLVLPFTALSALAGFLVMIPVTWILRDAGPMYAVAQAVLRAASRLGGVRAEVSGPDPRLAPQPCIYLCNHVSNVDPPALFVFLPRVTVMAKAVLFRWPLFGYALKLLEFIPVERGQADSRRQAVATGIARLKKGLSLLIFPEGTRSPNGALLPFRTGPFTMAIETQAPIVPITISGTREIMPKGKLGIRPGRARLVFHPPISTVGLTLADRDSLMEKVRAVIASALPDPSEEDGA